MYAGRINRSFVPRDGISAVTIASPNKYMYMGSKIIGLIIHVFKDTGDVPTKVPNLHTA